MTRRSLNSFNGYEHYNFLLEVDLTARSNFSIDPNSGDNLALTASGELDLAVARLTNQSQAEIGSQVDIYEMVSYSSVKTGRFENRSRSTIVWNGRPLDCYADISAKYEVRTAATL